MPSTGSPRCCRRSSASAAPSTWPWRSTRRGPPLRHAEFKEYKAHRPPMPDALSRQIPYIHRVVEAFAIPVVKLAGYEADDLIGTLAAQASSQGLEVVIVTGDKDMFQLLSPAVRI